MKKYLFSLIFILLSYVGFAQKGLSYQAVILDPNPIEAPGVDINGQPFINGDVWVKFSIYANSSMQFEEVHKTKTDAYGLVNLMIGSVSATSFNTLVWDSAQKTLQVHVSFDQGGSYTKVSDQKLTYNPYALYAETASKLGGTLAITGGGTGATTLADARVNLGIDKVDNTPDAAKPISAAMQAALDLKANKGDVPAATATITDADATTKGKIQLAGDLAGTAAAPTVPGLALKANTSDVTTALALKANTSDVTTGLAAKANTEDMTSALALKANSSDVTTALAVKADTAYVLTKVAAATIADADANTKGKIQLAGDLGGTAASPTIPGLVLKANAADLVTLTTVVNANTASITANSTVILLKAPIASPVFTGTVAIGTSTPSVAAALDITSTSKGLLLPRLTFAQKSTIISPEAGLILWCSDCGTNGELQVYNGTNFVNMVGANAQFALPAVSATSTASDITSSALTSGGSIDSDGGAYVTARGVVWNTNTNPTTSLSTKTSDGTGIGTFSSSISGLTSGVTYYVRAYATNSVGTKYGPEIMVNTAQAVATLASTTAASSIGATSATSGGNITYNGGATVTVSGLVWSTTSTPTIALSTKTTDGTANGIYSSSITGLTLGTLYYVRSYATNNVGTSYGAQTSFTTLDIPTISSTTAASSISSSSATSGGTITSDGGSAVTASGIVYGTSAGSSTYSVTSGSGTGIFTSNLTGLTPATTYYVRSFATNSVGTVYGSEISFTSLAIAPTLTTTAASSITKYAASASGTIISNGGSPVTSSGICWSTTVTPTTADSKTTDGTTSGTFSGSITRLTAGTTYYVRAYATNVIGTSYGDAQSFTTISTSTTLNIVGDAYGGGIIAYIYQSGDPGYSSINTPVLISATSDQTSGGRVNWSNSSNLSTEVNLSGASYEVLGAGSANTDAIISLYTNTGTYAAKTARDYRGGAYTDWYLPSRDELNKLYINRVVIGSFITNNTHPVSVYWTSNEANSSVANGQNFGTGSYLPDSKAWTFQVRAVRTTTLIPVAINNPVLAATAPAGITSTSATSGGNVIDEGATQVSVRGLVYGTTTGSSTYSVTIGSGDGTFSSTLTGLTQGTTYYVRSFATNVQGTGYGAETSFTTQTTATVSVTATPTSLTTTSAIGGGTISSNGGATITTSGLVWDASANPTIALSTKTTDGTTSGTFTSSITGLTQGATYHVRAYATNYLGTSYGPDITFTTITTPTVSTTATVTSITGTTVIGGGTISTDGGATVTTRGLVWGTSTGASTYSVTTGTGAGTFTSSLTGLSVATTYFVTAFATNSVGTVYGPEVSFATLAVEPAVSATSDATSITGSSATSGGTITANGGATVTVSGVVWSTTSTPTIALSTKTTDGISTGTFTSSLTGLTAATLYYVRAYATNSIGTAYGPQSSFTTLAIAPTISATATVTSITGTTATSGGTISSDGGSSVTIRGLVWGTSSGASTYSVSIGTGTGTFTSSLTGLSVATTYYVRAFATNTVGTVYGPEVSFATPTTATLSSTITSTIKITSAILGGVLSSNGGATTTVGIMYSTSSSFGTSTSTTINSNAIAGTYTTTITGLSGATIYYAKSFATNTAGTTYGPTISFTTNEADKIVGQLYGGGAVFYILKSGDPGYDANVQHGLILAPIGMGKMNWNSDNRATGATGTALGTGASNTNAIIASQGGALTNSAAGKARAYNGGGYTDWYLGSLDEIRKLNDFWSNIYIIIPDGYNYQEHPYAYWTSTESSTNTAQAYRKNIYSNDQYTENKNSQTWSVTAIRSF
jgi:hypothetical protein